MSRCEGVWRRGAKASWSMAVLGLGLGLAGCSGGGDGTPEATPGASLPPPICLGVSFSGSSSIRFPTGQTYYFEIRENPDCSVWQLSSAPEGNQSVVWESGAQRRFTPHLPGSYTFESAGGTLSLEVVEGTSLPFFNHNYYPTHSLLRVGDDLYTADVYRPTVTRLSDADLTQAASIAVGSWPVALAEGMDGEIVVAQRGGDTLGFVDLGAGHIYDGVWVGDEPADVVTDGQQAYVSLPTDGQVAVVDLTTHSVIGRVNVMPDATHLALSPDGATLYVAARRSGDPDRTPYGTDPVEDEQDVMAIDTASLSITDTYVDVAVIIGGLAVSDDGLVYMTRRLNNTSANLADGDDPSFMHEVAILDPDLGEVIHSADLSRQASSGGFAVALHGLAFTEGALWTVAEGSNLAIALDPDTLEEIARVPAQGRPRGIIGDESVRVHGAQGFVVTEVSTEGALGQGSTGDDPRPVEIADGQAYFTGAGRDYAQNWACNSCHLDGLTDALIWNAGPFEDRVVPRPLFWLEGGWPLGWAGYLANVRNYAYTVNTNVGVRPTTDEAVNLWRYLASLMPPPAANSHTQLNGALSETAQRGKSLYEGSASCAGCHPTPLTTSRAVFAEGITEGTSDTPVLVGIYRHGVWMKNGQSQTLHDAVGEAASWLGVGLTDDDSDRLVRYMQELTGRDLFILESAPRAREGAWPADEPITLTFSRPLWDDASNLAHISLVDDGGQAVAASVSIDAEQRHVTLSPSERLAWGAAYAIRVGDELEAINGDSIHGSASVAFTTAQEPALSLSGDYVWTIHMPAVDFEAGGFNPDITTPTYVSFTAAPRASGADLLVDYLQGLTLDDRGTVDGTRLRTTPLPIPIGPSFSDSTGIDGELVDLDGDGVGDEASGTLTISGPGFVVGDIAWDLARPSQGCEEGSGGSPAVTVTRKESGEVQIDWGDVGALGLYVTDPMASLPAGPNGTVSGGDAYWVLEAQSFPAGFAGPAVYGAAVDGADDESERHGAPLGGASLEEGGCYKFSITGNTFTTGYVTILW